MDRQKLKLAAVVGVIALALAGLAFSMKSAGKADEYAPSPGGQGEVAHMADGRGQQSSAPGMPGGPPSGKVPGSAH